MSSESSFEKETFVTIATAEISLVLAFYGSVLKGETVSEHVGLEFSQIFSLKSAEWANELVAMLAGHVMKEADERSRMFMADSAVKVPLT